MFPDDPHARMLLRRTPGREESDFEAYDFPPGLVPVPTKILAADQSWQEVAADIARFARQRLAFPRSWKVEKLEIVFFGPEAILYVYYEDMDAPIDYVYDPFRKAINSNFDGRKFVREVIRKYSEMKKNTEGSGDVAGALTPRWAEQNRPKKQVKLRLPPDLISALDEAAEREGITRNDWIETSIRLRLKAPAHS